jgi:Spy/CpxP family protein refolding chaperone
MKGEFRMKTAMATLAVLLCATALVAQTGPTYRVRRPRPADFEQLRTFLGLTDQQVDQIKNLRKAQLETVQPLLQTLRQTRQNLRAELKKDPIDSGRVSQLREQVESQLAALQTKRTELQTQIRNVLTSQQLSQLAQLENALKVQAAAREAVALGLITPPAGFRGMRGMLRRPLMTGPILGGAGRMMRGMGRPQRP